MSRRQPSAGVNGTIRYVYDGTRSAGYIVVRGEHWKAVASGGFDVGLYETSAEAARAVLSHAKTARAAH